ncbi:hypothetical protein F5884DRAFT_784635 [Xylogone sp. PMI_703]|nr:hypothetical protein F5884DRAFT_784635 [Xylogone sp. PMI_703]
MQLGLELPEDWVEENSHEVAFQLIILHAPAVEALFFEVYVVRAREDGELSLLTNLSRRRSISTMLLKLKAFHFAHWDARETCLDNFAGLFVLAPNISYLHADGCFGLPPRLPLDYVTELRLTDNILSPQGFGNIVSSCKRLRKLTYTAEGNFPAGSDEIRLENAINALICQSEYLESLHFDFNWPRCSSINPFHGEILKGGACPLSKFPALKSIRMDESCLYTKDINPDGGAYTLVHMLPKSVEYFQLDISVAVETTGSSIVKLMENIACLPNIKQIKIRLPEGQVETWTKNHTLEYLEKGLVGRKIVVEIEDPFGWEV